ncbi:retroviral-like aspartic protease family protein [Waterburya agarophytonicola K14]|uniref:Retroviral-like aspartic protease family protein n=2 Tax=Waterburya TaxID=2886915 RepID=A0A964BPA8_9CYAN|nr:retroviral-like aspartic protease family protein [Waterburya agarophytonicola KI4]
MLDSEGNSMNLGSLCQNSQPPKSRSNYQQPQLYQKDRGVYIIPIKSRVAGIPVIDVKFNDRYIFEMMLDTGASEIVITQAMAKKLKVKHEGTIWASTPSHSRVAMSAGYVYSVGVSDISQKSPLVITAPTMDMGLLGQSFFSGYDMTIKSDVIEFRER